MSDRTGKRVQELVGLKGAAATAAAQRDAGLANERAAVLEGDNLTLKGQINEQAGKVAGLEKEAAQARERAATAERQLLEVKQRIAPRHLLPAQRAVLLQILKATPGTISTSCVGGTPEPCNFYEELKSVLLEAGWTIGPEAHTWASVGSTSEGIAIRVRDRSNERANELRKALVTIGFAPRFEVNPEMEQEIELSVEPKEHYALP
jgi:hypothetical protein